MAWAGSTRRSRLPADWPAIRRAVLARDPVCRIAGPTCTRMSTEADHIVAGDDHRLEALQGTCANCHRTKSAREGNAARPREKRRPGPHPGLLQAVKVMWTCEDCPCPVWLVVDDLDIGRDDDGDWTVRVDVSLAVRAHRVLHDRETA